MNEFIPELLPTQVLSVLPNPVLVKDSNLEYVWVNKAFEDLFSVRNEDLVGRFDKDVFPDRQVAQCNGGDLRVLETGEIDEAVETVFRSSGEPRETITRKIRLDLGDGRVYLLGVMHDVTDVTRMNTALMESQAKLEEQAAVLEGLANTDPLTGCSNRYVLDTLEDKVFMNPDHAVSFYVIDVDNFKNINDQYGHSCGDEVLRQFARIVAGSLSSDEYFVRIGGEEFGIVETGLSLEDSRRKADSIRQLIESAEIEIGADKIKFTVSIGLSHKPESVVLDQKTMYMAADKALYEAKNSGRNLVVLAA